MKTLRNFEQILYKSQCIDSTYFPVLDEEDFTYMDIEASQDRSIVMCFPYYRHLDGKAYVDIYIWDVMLPAGYKRFVLAEGYSLNEGEEENFIEYLSGNIQIESGLLQQLVSKVNRDYPDIHLAFYSDRRHILLHLYYTLHKTGAYEILYKANLNYLAAGLGKFEGYDIIGSSPQKIFDVQLGMLRALNTPAGVELLETADNRVWSNRIYAGYHNFIRGKQLNKYQWKYLQEQILQGNPAEKKMFIFMGRLKEDSQYYEYLRYIEYKGVVDDYYSILPKFPKVYELEEHTEVCDMIEWYIEHESILDFYLRKKAGLYQVKYAYESRDYIVKVPSSVRELLTEAEQHHNCLYNYIYDMACNDTIILFMREKSNLRKPLIVIEVKDGAILQALCSFNREPDKKQKKFLEEFAESKELDFYDEEDDDEYEQ